MHFCHKTVGNFRKMITFATKPRMTKCGTHTNDKITKSQMAVLFSTYNTPVSANNNLLWSITLGGHGVTHYISEEHKAFQRCLRASLEGFAIYQ